MTSSTSVATVVLLPPEREQDLLELAQEWTAAWLIRSALWVKTSHITSDGGSLADAPPRIGATILGRNGSAAVGLFEELSRREFDLVRFVAVRSVEFGSPANHKLDEAVRILEDHLKVSKPTSTTLQFINVIVSPSRQAGASAEKLIEAGWNVNVIASPEDRRSPNSFDVFTRHSDSGPWAGFVLAHAVTAAGLWATIDTGPYDEAEFDGFMEGTHVQRVAVRGVLTGALVVNVARQAMGMAGRDESPLTDPLIAIDERDLRVMSPHDESKAIAQAVDFTVRLAGGQLAYRTLPNPPTIEPVRLGFFAQIKDVSAFGVDKVKETPRWIKRFFTRRVSQKATAELHGESGDALVDAQGILAWDDAELFDSISEINRQREQVVADFAAPVTARRHDIDGILFESLRKSCFALLDGSEFPEGFVLREVQADGNQAPIVSSISRVVPDWAHRWTPPEDVEVALGSFAQVQGEPAHWLDVDFTSAWYDELSRRAERLSTREGELRRRLGELRTRSQQNSELLEEAALTCDALRDEVAWLEEDLEAHEEFAGSAAEESIDVEQPSDEASIDQAIGTYGEPRPTTSPLEQSPDDAPAASPEEEADHAEAAMETGGGEDADRQASEAVEGGNALIAPVEAASTALDGGTADRAVDPMAAELRESLRERRHELIGATREESRIRREREQLRARERRTSDALEAVDEQMSLIQGVRDSLRAWVSARSGSFAWQLLVRLAHERQLAAEEFAQLRAAAETPITPQAELPSRMRDRFMRRSVISLAVVALVWLAITVLKYSLPDLAQIAPAVNPLAWPLWLTALVALLTFLTLWVLFLVTYYRETSRSRFQLRRGAAHVEYLSKTSLSAREEQQRLNALHAQVPDYLKYLSEAIHRPWELPSMSHERPGHEDPSNVDTPETVVFGSVRPRTDLLPSFMRLAESTPGAGGDREMALVRDTVRSLLHRGWRYGALCDLLAAAEEAESLPSGTFDPTRLDRDPRLRAALLAALQRSDAHRIAGRRQLRVLAERIQKQVMDQIHPPVSDLAPDPLKDLQIDEDLLGENDWRMKEWDDFLAEALSLPSNWSTLAFSVTGNSDGIDDVRAIGYGPERLVDLKDESVTYLGIAEKSTRPVELVIRIDRTQASRGPRSFRVFAGDVHVRPEASPEGASPLAKMDLNANSPDPTTHALPQDYLA